MDISDRRIGGTSITVSALGLGTAPLGGISVRVSADEAVAIVRTAVENGISLIDTAPYYGLGLSEHRVGEALRRIKTDRVVVATKVGRVLTPAAQRHSRSDEGWLDGLAFNPILDYSYEGVMRSYEDSLQRLGRPAVDMLAIHDLDPRGLGSEDRFEQHLQQLETRGGVRALLHLRATGAIGAVGLGINSLGAIHRVLSIIDLDYVIVAMPYTLLDQEALDVELPLCVEHGVSVIIGAVFASGILAVANGNATYGYELPPPEITTKVAQMREICARHGVPLAAAALQFPLAHPAVAAVIPGAVSAAQVRENSKHFKLALPSALWVDMKTAGLLRPDAPVPA